MDQSKPILLAWDESGRLEALRALKLLDTKPEHRFDRVTQMAKEVLQVPIVFITLVDRDRQWFKSRQGFDATETSREISFCSHAILQDDIFIVEDAHCDPRFADNPLVTGAPYIRFYAGKPLYTIDRKKIGTLCIIDHVPRQLNAAARTKLESLAAWAEREINLFAADADAMVRLENKLRLAHVFECAAEGIFSVTFDGTIESTNPAACEMFRFSAPALVGKNIRELVPARDYPAHDAFMQRMRESVRDAARTSFEAVGLRADGDEFPMEVSFSMIEVGARKFFTGLVRDITERKQQARLKSEFVASVSHELRTPLTSILGALGMVIEDMAEGVSDEARELIEIAYRNSQRLNALVNDILDIEKLDAGMTQFYPTVCSATELLEEACHLNQLFAKKLSVHLQLDLPALPMAVKVDRLRFTQIMTNLISNACKFSPVGKVVHVNAFKESTGWVRFTVVDEGAGIPDEFRSRIFQRFAQAKPSRNHKQTGTGLGLSLSKEMVEKMGGRIGYVSPPGAGAIFHIAFPLVRETGQVHLSQ